jgi:S1-C subfamily serine protease
VAYDHDTGCGLLRTVHPIDSIPMKLGKSADVEESTQLLISGYGGAAAAQPVIVVSRRVFAGYWEYLLENAIFTAPPYRNFGGAALVSTDGQLIGIGSLVVGDAVQGQQQIPGNMFVPIDILKPILKDLVTSGRASGSLRPWLGVYTEEFRERLFVTRVADQGPAAKAGIEAGDIIVAVDGQDIASMEDFYRRVWAQGDAGAQAALTVLRGSKLMNITVESGNRYEWLRLNPV